MGLFYDSASAKRDANTLRLNDLAKSIGHVTNRADIVVFRDCFMSSSRPRASCTARRIT